MLNKLLIGVEAEGSAGKHISSLLEKIKQKRNDLTTITVIKPRIEGDNGVLKALDQEAQNGDAVLLLHSNLFGRRGQNNQTKIDANEKHPAMQTLRAKAHVATASWCSEANREDYQPQPNPPEDFLDPKKGLPPQVCLLDRTTTRLDTLIAWLDDAIRAKTPA